MNILFFLTPKSEVAFLYDDQTLRQALEIMEYHRYTAVPVINKQGEYIGTITEGDMLWGIKNEYNLSLKGAEQMPVTTIPRRSDNRPVSIYATMEDMIAFNLKFNAENGFPFGPQEEAERNMRSWFPALKRWKNA